MAIEEQKSTSVVRHISKYVGILSGSVAVAGIGFGRACRDGAKAAGKLFIRSKNEEEDGSQAAETAVVEPAEAAEPEAAPAPAEEQEPAAAEKPEEEPEPEPKSDSKAKAKKTKKPVKEAEKEAAPSL